MLYFEFIIVVIKSKVLVCLFKIKISNSKNPKKPKFWKKKQQQFQRMLTTKGLMVPQSWTKVQIYTTWVGLRKDRH